VYDGLGENLEGGYWLWTWNGKRYVPQKPTLFALLDFKSFRS
jgi:hypothetical protein